MLQPRSYLFTRQTTPKISDHKHERPAEERKPRSASKQNTKSMSPATITDIRPTTPSSPVVIPMRGHTSHEKQKSQLRKGHQNSRRGSEKVDRRARIHSPDALPPSVAALLAITAIPPQRVNGGRPHRGSGQQLTVDAIMQHTGESENRLDLSLGKSPLDFLLSPPDDDDEIASSENGQESVMSTRTLSSDSMPSLDDESIDEASPSLGSLVTPTSLPRSKRPTRRVRTLSSPLGTLDDHPLYAPEIDLDELDFRVFQKSPHKDDGSSDISVEPPARKSAFKSNLTASLRALRNAAKSFSSLTTPMLTPDDFLTRSIITIDPQIPFTDERMPPRLEDTPTPALRRYLNPTTNAPIEAHVPSSLAQTMSSTQCTASIQMQTYNVSRSKTGTAPSVISRRTTTQEAPVEVATGPLARQRDMRENSDFIRVAVMEMLMRKKGKLDELKPGRAKWALPPRKPPTKPYARNSNGVPVRWIGVTP